MRWLVMEKGVENRPDAPMLPPGEGEGGPPREARRSRLLACDMRLADGRVVKARIRNISSGGMGGRTDAAVEPWQRVEMNLPGIGTVAGRIAWVRQGQFGVEFTDPIDPADVTASPGAARSDHVVPHRFQPATDFRRPGLRSRI